MRLSGWRHWNMHCIVLFWHQQVKYTLHFCVRYFPWSRSACVLLVLLRFGEESKVVNVMSELHVGRLLAQGWISSVPLPLNWTQPNSFFSRTLLDVICLHWGKKGTSRCLPLSTLCFGAQFWEFLLASLGQQRSRMLATLFKDERCQQLAAYGILEKMYLDRIIRGNQLQEFAAMLMPHQKATTADGTHFSKTL